MNKHLKTVFIGIALLLLITSCMPEFTKVVPENENPKNLVGTWKGDSFQDYCSFSEDGEWQQLNGSTYYLSNYEAKGNKIRYTANNGTSFDEEWTLSTDLKHLTIKRSNGGESKFTRVSHNPMNVCKSGEDKSLLGTWRLLDSSSDITTIGTLTIGAQSSRFKFDTQGAGDYWTVEWTQSGWKLNMMMYPYSTSLVNMVGYDNMRILLAANGLTEEPLCTGNYCTFVRDDGKTVLVMMSKGYTSRAIK